MTYTYRASVLGTDIKESNSWSNIIRYAKELAKNHQGLPVKVSHYLGHNSESFIWDNEISDIIPF